MNDPMDKKDKTLRSHHCNSNSDSSPIQGPNHDLPALVNRRRRDPAIVSVALAVPRVILFVPEPRRLGVGREIPDIQIGSSTECFAFARHNNHSNRVVHVRCAVDLVLIHESRVNSHRNPRDPS